MKTLYRPIVSIVLLFICPLAAAQGRRAPQPPTNERAQRIAPPAAITCDRNHLTSFTGRILLYQLKPNRIVLRVRTDEATTENFTIKPAPGKSAEQYFLLRGEAFKTSDWSSIESAAGKLKRGMRATVWVCDDGSTPVVDWRPAEK
jgi:hypothetical protein